MPTAAGSLPVSGVALHLREPTGDDELIALEQGPLAAATMLALAQRLGRDDAGRPIEWAQLPAVDLAAGALLIRRAWLGERIRTETICPTPGCAEPIDVSFRISDYLAHHRSAQVRGLEATDDGWYAVRGGSIAFRVPTIDDVVTAQVEHRDGDWLGGRCLRPASAPPADRRRAERMLERVAPRLDGPITGHCPACDASVELHFDPIGYVVSELRDVSAGLYADVHELAFAYRWSEAAILGLSRGRRHSYVAMIRGELALA
ncbi:MAG: hypothetical protein ABSH51_02675 [Solirubrobacteraceae bacterium]|jgi:hypothetical protein